MSQNKSSVENILANIKKLRQDNYGSDLLKDTDEDPTPVVISSQNQSTSSSLKRKPSTEYNPTHKIVHIDTRLVPSSSRPGPKAVGYKSIIVNKSQKGNPLLNHIKNVNWEYGSIKADYVLGATTCALFLSLKYHRLHPEYIYTRMQKLGKDFELRVILVVVDIEDHAASLRELTNTSITNGFTIVLSWSSAEAGNYLSLFKQQETAKPTLIKGQTKNDFRTQMTLFLTTGKTVNKTNALNLVSNYGSLRKVIEDGGNTFEMIEGLGQQKAKSFHKVVTEPFIYNKVYPSDIKNPN